MDSEQSCPKRPSRDGEAEAGGTLAPSKVGLLYLEAVASTGHLTMLLEEFQDNFPPKPLLSVLLLESAAAWQENLGERGEAKER